MLLLLLPLTCSSNVGTAETNVWQTGNTCHLLLLLLLLLSDRSLFAVV
jgi:hypothetical protein